MWCSFRGSSSVEGIKIARGNLEQTVGWPGSLCIPVHACVYIYIHSYRFYGLQRKANRSLRRRERQTDVEVFNTPSVIRPAAVYLYTVYVCPQENPSPQLVSDLSAPRISCNYGYRGTSYFNYPPISDGISKYFRNLRSYSLHIPDWREKLETENGGMS